MHYVTGRPSWMLKHMFSVTCPDTLFMGLTPGVLLVRSTPGPAERKNSVSMFHALDAPECTT
jgi:hypothetical protein